MRVNFIGLDKACPRDCYPLPQVDNLVNATMDYEVMVFLDAYKRYHQIEMSEQDQEKTVFITEHGTYCYKTIPFGLKNAGATYQRLVDKLFKQQIGKNMEVYINDMLVKSKHVLHLTTKFQETFNVL